MDKENRIEILNKLQTEINSCIVNDLCRVKAKWKTVPVRYVIEIDSIRQTAEYWNNRFISMRNLNNDDFNNEVESIEGALETKRRKHG